MDQQQSLTAPKPPTNSKPFKIRKTKKGLVARIKRAMIRRLKPDKEVLILMQLRNGIHRMFIIAEKDGGFKYNKKQYHLNEEQIFYDLDAQLWGYYFHEDISLLLSLLL